MNRIKVRYPANLAELGAILLDEDMTSAGIPYGNEVRYVNKAGDFPAAVAGVRTLLDNVTYKVRAHVDMGTDRFVGGVNTVILGESSENCSITSDLAPGVALITSEYSLPIRHISFEVTGGGKVFDLAGDGVNNAYDWFGVNFLGGNVGTIGSCSNFVVQSMAILAADSGFEFTGNHGTISFRDLFSLSNGYSLKIASGATVSRRFRVLDSSIIANGSAEGINVDVAATIPTESYILDRVNFSGSSASANRIVGVQHTDNKALFERCTGISNSAKIGAYSMNANATATTIAAPSTYYKIAGTTTADANNQKFTHSNNRLTYVGKLSQVFELTAMANVTGTNNHEIGIRFYKNGQAVGGYEGKSTLSSSGRAENVSVRAIVPLQENDYIELFIENYTAGANATVTDMFVSVKVLFA